MKILPGFPPPTPAPETAENSAEKVAAPLKQKTAKPAGTADQVVFSSSLGADLKYRQDSQAKRVESIRSRLKAGTYQVSSREVAERMLSVTPDLTT